MCIYQQLSKVSQNTSMHVMATKALRINHAYVFLIPPVNIRALHITHSGTSFNGYIGRSMLLILKNSSGASCKRHDMQDAVTCASH